MTKTNTAHFPMASFPAYRARRLRSSQAIRALVRENMLSADDLIWPIFLRDGTNLSEEIDTMPGVSRHTIDHATKVAESAVKLGIPCVALFPYVEAEAKTADCSKAWDPDNLANRATRRIKQEFPDLLVMLDIALDPYNLYGHDGIVRRGIIVNDETLECLRKQALAHAAAGADILGPSDMMDGRVGVVRTALEASEFKHVSILSYSAKYNSAFYGPFRDAVGSGKALKGDKATYQMDPGNGQEALRMVARDLQEGADMVMVKPGMPYLDICRMVTDRFQVPTFAYQVSGEYAMLMSAIRNGFLERESAILECLIAFKRAGCAGVLTYFAPEAAKLLRS